MIFFKKICSESEPMYSVNWIILKDTFIIKQMDILIITNDYSSEANSTQSVNISEENTMQTMDDKNDNIDLNFILLDLSIPRRLVFLVF